MAYRLEPVNTPAAIQSFHQVAYDIYRNDPHWVAPLESEVEDVFNPKKNGMFADGEAIRWILKNGAGKAVGRIGAFYNRTQAERKDLPVGGMGFFECVNDKAAAAQLFDAAKAWLAERGMEAADGPINFGENDRFWGLLIEGFTHPSFGMAYNPSYYQELFEAYGFKIYYEQVSRHLDITQPAPERFRKIAEWVSKKHSVRIETADLAQLQKYTKDFATIYNEAWQFHENFAPMNESHAIKLAKGLQHVVIPRLFIFAYVGEDPAGFLFCLPDLNQIFKPLKGKFGLWQKLLFKWRSRNDFKWYRDKGILTRGRVLIIGVKPKYQKYGLESGMTLHSWDDAVKMGFKEIELSWVGDFNPMSRKLQDASGAELGKIHRTYRLMFDPTKTWDRSKTLAADPRKKVEA